MALPGGSHGSYRPDDYPYYNPSQIRHGGGLLPGQSGGRHGGAFQAVRPAARGQKTHQYQPLDERLREIRLLRYQGYQKSFLGEYLLSFTVEVVSLLDEPLQPYYAISYAWGTEVEWESILLDGAEVKVPQSAFHALSFVFFTPSQMSASVFRWWPVWIDAICIHQYDLLEKSRQVAMMRDIYAGAEAVLVWLGSDDSFTESAFETVRTLAEDCSRWIVGEEELGRNEQLPVDEQTRLPYWSSPPPYCDWEAFGMLLTSRWFSRIWVLQEVAHARIVKCFRGLNFLAWEDLAKAVRWTHHRGFWRGSNDSLCGNVGPNKFASLTFVEAMFKLKDAPFDELLCLNFGFDASDGFDRIYALLGMRGYQDVVRLYPAEVIISDYELSLKDVYAQAMYLAILSSDSLRPLSFVPVSRSPAPGWASWVPRFYRLEGRRELVIFSQAIKWYSACDSLPVRCSRSVDGRVLHVAGIPLGRIAAALTLAPFQGLEDRHMENGKALSLRLACVWSLKAQSEPSAARLAKVLFARKDSEMYLWKETFLAQDFAALILEVVQQCPWLHGTGTEHSLRLARGEEGDGRKFAKLLRNMVALLNLSSIAVLEDGRFAFCIGDVRVGDEICILFSGNILFVLRGRNDCHRLAGFADLPGVMKGEHVQHLREEGSLEAETRTFHIH